MASSLLTNLQAYWALDEASGTRADSHTGGHTLTDNNTTGSGTGKISLGADFDSIANEFLSLADHADLSMGAISFSISLWAKIETKTSDMTLIHKGTNTSALTEYHVFYDMSADRFAFTVGDGSVANTIQAVAAGSPSSGVWYHIIATHENGVGLRIRIDNQFQNTVGHTTGSQDTAGSLEIGDFSSGSTNFNGLIDEVGVWKKLLSSVEIAQLYNSGNGLAYPFSATEGADLDWVTVPQIPTWIEPKRPTAGASLNFDIPSNEVPDVSAWLLPSPGPPILHINKNRLYPHLARPYDPVTLDPTIIVVPPVDSWWRQASEPPRPHKTDRKHWYYLVPYGPRVDIGAVPVNAEAPCIYRGAVVEDTETFRQRPEDC
jgi:hypothetical protein